MPHGIEWIVDATGCPPAHLRDRDRLERLFERIVEELDLHPVGRPAWHRFPDAGGLTGFWMLQESHLAVHTFPEFGSLCVNLFCCRPRRAWEWEARLAQWLGARRVSVRSFERDHGPDAREESA
ncbi:MAG: S-adenosylmethionine decarboxylase [Planctomycetes bacterium]|nr:S-adenosylmethionine decarboxylase [Planctomycetota bacterium]